MDTIISNHVKYTRILCVIGSNDVRYGVLNNRELGIGWPELTSGCIIALQYIMDTKKILMVVVGGIILGAIGYFVFFSGKAQPQTIQPQPTIAITPVITMTATPSSTITITLTPTPTKTLTPTATATTKPTATPTGSAATPTPTAGASPTPTPSV